jgi:hypothetical protein
MYGDKETPHDTGHVLLRRVLADVAISLNASKTQSAEDRRIHWTTYKNLLMWFDNWERDLVDLGFAYVHPSTGIVVIPIEQLKRIVNIDATCLSLDGSDNVRGGRPEVYLYDPRIHQVGKATSKSLLTSTMMITGSNAAGEAIVPHFQFQSKAKSDDTMRLQYDVAEHMPCVVGQFGFGCEEERTCWPVTFGQNEKRWIDEVEFEKYLLNCIVPLYPDAKNMPGHRVLLKDHSGPGRMNIRLLTKLRCLGFVLYPCVPNTTHVTQETDKCYGP